jgi:hypothetical protein
MLAHDRIELLERELFGRRFFVLGRGVEVTGTGSRFEFDFFTHDRISLDGASGAKIGEYSVNAVLVDEADASRGQAQTDEAVFALNPEAAALQVWQEAALGAVVSVRNIVSHHRLFAGDLTDA